MQLRALCSLAVLSICFSYAHGQDDVKPAEEGLIRLIRASGTKKQQECRYDKEAWEECEATTGLQRRALKLKSKQGSLQCEAVKYITRPCKKACKYLKGTWTDCVDGARSRVDQLRNVGSGCEATRPVTRKCKSVCRYSKSDWTTCENGTKTKTLSLTEGGNECEKSKIISKQCAEGTKQRSAAKGKHGRKNPAKPTEAA
jgi:hypothetical protein